VTEEGVGYVDWFGFIRIPQEGSLGAAARPAVLAPVGAELRRLR